MVNFGIAFIFGQIAAEISGRRYYTVNKKGDDAMFRLIERILLIVTVLILLCALFLTLPFNKVFLSLGVMSIYSHRNVHEYVQTGSGLTPEIPGGLKTAKSEWYPKVLCYYADDFFSPSGEGFKLTVFYNFPAFDFTKGCSRLYDPESPYYCSFYGAYILKGEENCYGFDEEGELEEFAVAAVARYDYQQLVLRDFGLNYSEAVFDFTVEKTEKDWFYAESEGWTRVDAKVRVNGCAHKKDDFALSYLQYGSPGFEVEQSFAPVELFGRIYGKTFEEEKTSLFFYILCADRQALEDCDRQILSKSRIS